MDSDKTRLRRLWRARLAAAAEPGNEELAAALETWAQKRGFDVVLATLALPAEPDLSAFYLRWLERGHRLGLARTAENHGMDFGLVTTWDDSWNAQASSLREPSASASAWTPGPATLALIPGLAFAPAPEGGVLRLGRGGGYFDRWLAVHGRHVTTLGVGFPYQLTDALPRDPHDILLDGYMDHQGFHGLEPHT